jgi:hypothetical protein
MCITHDAESTSWDWDGSFDSQPGAHSSSLALSRKRAVVEIRGSMCIPHNGQVIPNRSTGPDVLPAVWRYTDEVLNLAIYSLWVSAEGRVNDFPTLGQTQYFPSKYGDGSWRLSMLGKN